MLRWLKKERPSTRELLELVLVECRRSNEEKRELTDQFERLRDLTAQVARLHTDLHADLQSQAATQALLQSKVECELRKIVERFDRTLFTLSRRGITFNDRISSEVLSRLQLKVARLDRSSEVEARASQILTSVDCDKGSIEQALSALEEQRRFPEFFFLQYFSSQASREERLRLLSLSIRCEWTWTESMAFCFGIYASEFVELNKSSLLTFERIYSGKTIIVMHISCAERSLRAYRSAASFTENEFISNLVIIGDPSTTTYRFDCDQKCLFVPCADSYEKLPLKVASALRFLGFSNVSAAVLKVDDDIQCREPNELTEVLLHELGRSDYAGRIWDPMNDQGIDRTWHFRKCSIPDEPYSRLGIGQFAEGPAYLLSSRAINLLARLSVYVPHEFEQDLYEDMTIGRILSLMGIVPTDLDLRKLGLLMECPCSDD